MPETIQCVYCNSPLRLPEQFIGQEVRCPSCNKSFTAQLPTAPPPPPIAPPREEPPPPPPRDDDRPRPRRPIEDDDEDYPRPKGPSRYGDYPRRRYETSD